MQTQYLTLSWSTSKGRDTYGYNICRLDAGRKQRYRTCGGGYDMTGTVVGLWLEANYQDRLVATIGSKAGATYSKESGHKSADHAAFYGSTYHMPIHIPSGDCIVPARISLDGACGLCAMEHIAEAIGVSLSSTCNRRGHTTGFMVTDYGSGEALKAARNNA